MAALLHKSGLLCCVADHIHVCGCHEAIPLTLTILNLLFFQEAEVVIKCHNTGDQAVVQWIPYSKAKERYRELNGKVVDNMGEVQYLLHGAWDKGMTRKRPGDHQGKHHF